jgi:DNA-directed RNA polymerase subunit M/transcription elongation factor TFIIS
MTKREPASCPRCGNKKPELIDERTLDEDGETVRVLLYRCVCGNSFTQTVKKPNGKSP